MVLCGGLGGRGIVAINGGNDVISIHGKGVVKYCIVLGRENLGLESGAESKIASATRRNYIVGWLTIMIAHVRDSSLIYSSMRDGFLELSLFISIGRVVHQYVHCTARIGSLPRLLYKK